MKRENEFHGAVNLIYEAVLDDRLWPKALTKLADFMGTGHIGFCAMDRRTNAYDSLARRTDPTWSVRYKQYWAFHNPLWALSTRQPANEVTSLDDLIPREQFSATPYIMSGIIQPVSAWR